ncbi:carbohydrate ABC transporter permease [Celerinatantimonas sp. YJH-8]|uniref:carbohydrate ABC transporter permease n=1 Tax=Celerinatantimonas sp. YJH-8 TaxID=3228714 RepID=UPI0038C1FEAB
MRLVRWRPYLLMAPVLACLALFTYVPLLRSLYDSLFDTRMADTMPFVGWANYQRLFADPVFWQACWNNLLYIAMTVAPSLVLALGLAVWLKQNTRINQAMRAVIFMPMVLPLVSVATLFLFVYLPSMGLLDYYLSQLFGFMNHNFLGMKSSVLVALAALGIWKFTGYYMLFFLAGLQAIPSDVQEAAKMEGASRWQIFRYITWPMLRPTINFVVTVAVIYAITQIDHVAVMTEGGPAHASTTLLFYIQRLATQTHDYGKASAATLVMLVVLVTLTIVNLKYLERGTHYEHQ